MSRRIHTSWILAWSSAGIMLGVGLSVVSKDYFINLPWLIIGISLVASSLINRKMSMVVLTVLGGLLVGLWRGTQNYPVQNAYDGFLGKTVDISGVVSEDIALGQDGQKQIKIKNTVVSSQSLGGQIWISSDSSLDIKRSDYIEAKGKLSSGFGSFSAAMYRADIIKLTRIKHGDPALEIRDWFSDKIRQVVKEPQASLGIGFLSGQHSTLPQSLTNNLRILGLTHIIVASGYNLTILARFARRWLMGISKYSAMVGSLFLVVGFIMVTGSSPSMTRASLITTLSLLAWYYGRKIHPLVILTFSAGVTILFNPAYLWGDLGWYLSFAAFAGVIIFSPLLLDYFWGSKEPNAALRVVVETFSAQVLTAPIIAFAFGQYAPLALIANVLILPLIPVAMILTFLAGLGAVLFAPLAHLISLPAQFLLNYMTFTASKLADLPFAQGNVSFSLSVLIGSYVLIAAVCIWLWRRTKHDFMEDSIVE